MKEDKVSGWKRKQQAETHDFLTAPLHTKNFLDRKWDVSAKTKYQQYACKTKGCKNKYAPVVVIMLANGSANLAIRIMLWRSLLERWQHIEFNLAIFSSFGALKKFFF